MSVDVSRKIATYLRACWALRGANLRGLGVIPKRLWHSAPYNRTGFNEFILWIKSLHLESVSQVIDVGANHGDFSQAASSIYPGCRCLLIEPLPTLQVELTQRCRHYAPNWQLLPDAIGSVPGRSLLYVDPRMDAIGSLAGFSQEYLAANPEVRPGRAHECTVRTLDEVCEALRIAQVDLLKIDVEGFESEVVDGASQTLEITRSIILELSLVRRSGTEPSALPMMLNRLTDRGFQTVGVIPSLTFANQLWRPKEFNLLMRHE